MSTMSHVENPYSAFDDAGMGEVEPYRSLSRSAVISVALAGVSLLALVFPGLLIVPVVGAVLGVTALSSIRRYPNEYSGWGLAVAGATLCSLLFVTSASLHAYEYYTEVPEGYERITFSDLQPEKGRPEPIPPKAIDLQGQKVFVKGYMHPGVASSGKVNHFILVPDMGTCCFGGQPKPTDMIEVLIKDDSERVAYGTRRIKLAGTFVVTPQPTKRLGLEGVWYHLEAEEVN